MTLNPFVPMSELSPVDGPLDEEIDQREYSARLDEVLGDSDEGSNEGSDSEGFVYDGADAEPSGAYHEQLSEILEQKFDELDEIEDGDHVERLLQDAPSPLPSGDDVQEESVTTTSVPELAKPSPRRPNFLHPNVSRLRSYATRAPSAGSVHSAVARPVEATTPSLSALSRTSSNSNLSAPRLSHRGDDKHSYDSRVPFRWSTMKSILSQIKAPPSAPPKAANILGGSETPTAMAANGLICIGTSQGRIMVFDFKQNLKAICTTEGNSMITAIALSQDRTFVVVGHIDGRLHLFDLADPSKPARKVQTNSRALVASGRREGHLHGSRINHVGFIGARHTAIVSSDEYGLAFYHSLGKVLFVEATDELRLLGKYPIEENPQEAGKPTSHRPSPKDKKRPTRWLRQSPNIISMLPLPLGTNPHQTDVYNVVALITMVKLVIVAIKPSPKTWYRKRRVEDRFATVDIDSISTPAACLAWFPSIQIKADEITGETATTTTPTLAYSWNSTVKLVTVREELPESLAKSAKRGVPHEQAKLVFEEIGSWNSSGPIRRIQWLSPYQILSVLDHSLEVWDIREGFKRVESTPFSIDSLISLPVRVEEQKLESYEHNIHTYKGKVFMLGKKDVMVGNLLSWTDHILTLVERGDSLAAIELATAYHVGSASGNQNGLPRQPEARKKVTEGQLRELMDASLRHAFSLERLTDATHRTAGNRGVDRTSLFEGLVICSVHACNALDDLDFLFETVFEYYDNAGIAAIFLRGIEPFLLDRTIASAPPWITQRLVSLHVDDEDFRGAEALIWHLDPMSLDINQVIHLCRERGLWDALIYVYTRALKDFVGPVVELLTLVRRVQKWRTSGQSSESWMKEDAIERETMDAYKIFPYIAATLSGLAYPSQQSLPHEEAQIAKGELYKFIIDGRSRVWPKGPSGKLILTTDEEGGLEPTYPYLRLLLKFDPESMLHTLDIAFEDSYLNDDNQGVGRLIIIKILLEMLGSGAFPQGDATLVRIFVARNIPKYPQYIKMPPSLLHSVLVGLASDNDADTREDRQLAAEYLLSVYKPREGDSLIDLFEEAGFFRILRARYQAERQWSLLLQAYLQDPEISSIDLLQHVDQVAASSLKSGSIPTDVLFVVLDALPRLLSTSISQTAVLVDKRMPDQHQRVLEELDGDPKQQLIYLRTLLEPSKMSRHSGDEFESMSPSNQLDETAQRQFLELLCQLDEGDVVEALNSLTKINPNLQVFLPVFKEKSAHEAVVFILQRFDKPTEALEYIEETAKSEGETIVSILNDAHESDPDSRIKPLLDGVERMFKRVIAMCQQTSGSTPYPANKQWIRLLRCQILMVQHIVDKSDATEGSEGYWVVSELRSLIQTTFDSLLLRSTDQGISFPQLFRELVTSATQENTLNSSTSTELYAEFRMILTGMLNAYHYEGELLATTSALINRDLDNLFEEWTTRRGMGWKANQAVCANCTKSFLSPAGLESTGASRPSPIRITATGQMFHVECPT